MSNSDSSFDALIAKAVAAGIAAAQSPGVIPPRRYVNNREAAERIGIVPDTLSEMRSRGEGPVWSGRGRFTRYAVEEIDRWIGAQPTAEK